MLEQLMFFLTTIATVGLAFIGAYILYAIMHLPLYFKGKR